MQKPTILAFISMATLASALTLDVSTLGSGTLANRLTTLDASLTIAGYDGAPAALHQATLNEVPSLGTASINAGGGDNENATTRGSEALQLVFHGPTSLQSLTLTGFGASDGTVKLTGFPFDPAASTSATGVTLGYDPATEVLSITPPGTFQAAFDIDFAQASSLRTLTLTCPDATSASNGVGISSLSYSLTTETAPRPNVLFINCDDLGYGDLGVLWQNARSSPQKFSTPNLDLLAAEGMILDGHACSTPVCVSSRAQLMLGRHAGHCRVRDNQFGNPLPDHPTLGTVTHKAGYWSAALGKWGVGSKTDYLAANPQNRGFDECFAHVLHNGAYYAGSDPVIYDGIGYGEIPTAVGSSYPNAYQTDLMAARAKHIIIERTQDHPDEPWFIYLAFKAPHAPITKPATAFPPTKGLAGGLDWPLTVTIDGSNDDYVHPEYAVGITGWPANERTFATMVRRIDEVVGDLHQTIKDLGIANDTLIVFTSDNGPHDEGHNVFFFGSQGPLDGFKRDFYEGGLRQPTLAWWPGKIAPGSRSFLPTSQYDWVATLAELAGNSVPGRCDGLSFAPLLTGTGPQRRHPFLYFEHNDTGSNIDPTLLDRKNYANRSQRNHTQALRIGHRIGIRYNVLDPTDLLKIYDTRRDLHEDFDLRGQPVTTAIDLEMQERLRQTRRPLTEYADWNISRPYDDARIPPRPPTGTTAPGLCFASFNGTWPWVPDFRELPPVAEGVASTPDLANRPGDDHFGMHYEGWLQVPSAGDYTFYLNADLGAHLWIHDSHLIDGDEMNGVELSAATKLAAGLHPIRIYYTHRSGSRSLSLDWSGPGIAREPIPASALFHSPDHPRLDLVTRDDDETTTAATPVLIDVLANDYHESPFKNPQIASISPPGHGTAALSGEEILYTPEAGFLGIDSFTYTLSDGTLSRSATVVVDVHSANTEVWLPFDQNDGDTTPDASGELRAVAQKFNETDTRWAPGRFGEAFAPDGSAGNLVLPGHRGVAGTNARTVAAWIKTSSTGAICAWGNNGTNGGKWVMTLSGASTGTLSAPDESLTFTATGGTLYRAVLNGQQSLGVEGIATGAGDSENATVRGGEAINMTFASPADLTGIGLTAWGPSDGLCKISGFSANPGAASIVAGISFSYTSGTLTINPPSAFSGLVPITFTSATNIGTITFTCPNADSSGHGVGLNSITHGGTMLTVDSLIGPSGGALRVEVGGGSIVGSTGLEDDQWHHVACTFSNEDSPNITEAELFVDGLPETISSSIAQSVNTATSSDLTIGTAFGASNFNGLIDEFRLIPRSLSSAEIAELASDAPPASNAWHFRNFGPGVPQWNLDDDSDGHDRQDEYLFGLQPFTADPVVLSLDSLGVGEAILTTTRRSPGADGVSYELQASPDMFSWSPSAFEELSVTPFLDGSEQITIKVPATDRKRFFRWTAR